MEEAKHLTTQLQALKTGYGKEAESIYHNIPWTLRTYNPRQSRTKGKKNEDMCFIYAYVCNVYIVDINNCRHSKSHLKTEKLIANGISFLYVIKPPH